MDINKKQKKAWYKKWWVYVIIVILGAAAIQAASDNKDTSSDSSKEKTSTTARTPSFKIDSYIKKPMKDIAKEFGQQYDWNDNHQVKAKKGGYDVIFEDAGKEDSADPLKLLPTGYATHAIIDLPDVGKCSNDEVFNKTDEVIKAAGLNPDDKGEKNPNITFGADYASYLNYKGDNSLELQVSCKYKDGPWQVIIVVRPEARS